MASIKSSIFLFFLFGAAFATVSASPEFETPFPDFAFNTGMTFTTGFECEVTSGTVIDGDPCEGVASVCPGTEIRITPTAYANWGTPGHELIVPYLLCSSGPCLEPDAVGALSITSHRATWLSPSLYEDYAAPDGYAFFMSDVGTTGEDHYDELGTFYDVPASYYDDVADVWYYDRRARANVFCEGTIQVNHNSPTGSFGVGTSFMPSPGTSTVTLDALGAHTIQTQLTGGECFAAAAKLPLERGTTRFTLIYYGYNTPMVPAAPTTSPVITVTEGTCEMEHIGSTAATALTPGGATLVSVFVLNSGDMPATTSGVSASAGFFAAPLDAGYCDALGIPPFACRASGFGIPVAPGNWRELFVYLSQDAASTGCPEITIEYECADSGCGGGGGTQTFTFDMCDAMSCEIDPPAADMPQGEEVSFSVTCFDLAGAPTPCPSGDWTLSGILGEVYDESSTGANAIAESSVGARGNLEFDCGGSCTPCASDLTVVESRLDCWIEPSGAEIEIGDSEDFDVFCEYDDAPVIPDSADWEMEDGLDGTLDDDGVDGARITATVDSAGNLVVTVTYGGITVRPSVPVITGEPEIVPPDELPPGEDESSTDFCEIHPAVVEGATHSLQTVSISCGPPGARVPCDLHSVTWRSSPLGIVDLARFDRPDMNHLWRQFMITGAVDSWARVIAWIDGDEDQRCSTVVQVAPSSCVEYS
ncbi:MAG: hypothetical protein ABII71_01460 [Candidatus Micrarchaeota archaeon]